MKININHSLYKNTIKIGNNNIFYITNNNYPNRKNLFFLSGWPVSCHMFEPLIENLKNYNCIAVDLPGFGNSISMSDPIKYDFNFYKNTLNKITDFLYHKNHFSIFGYSIGAVHGINIASLNISNLDKLILYAPPLVSNNLKETFENPLSRDSDNSLQNNDVESSLIFKKYNYFFVKFFHKHPLLIQLLNKNNSQIKSHIIKKVYKIISQRLYPDLEKKVNPDLQDRIINETVKFNLNAVMETAVELYENDSSKIFLNLNLPILVLCGNNDKIVDSEKCQKLCLKNQSAYFKLLNNLDHNSGLTKSTEIAKEINSFL